MGVVYAITDCGVTWSQGQTPLAKGDVWDADADLVRERPDLFSKEPTRVRGVKSRPAPEASAEAPVETGTAAPGEKRATRRRSA